jgi:hypothetical protein
MWHEFWNYIVPSVIDFSSFSLCYFHRMVVNLQQYLWQLFCYLCHGTFAHCYLCHGTFAHCYLCHGTFAHCYLCHGTFAHAFSSTLVREPYPKVITCVRSRMIQFQISRIKKEKECLSNTPTLCEFEPVLDIQVCPMIFFRLSISSSSTSF